MLFAPTPKLGLISEVRPLVRGDPDEDRSDARILCGRYASAAYSEENRSTEAWPGGIVLPAEQASYPTVGGVVTYLLGLQVEADSNDVLVFEVDREEVADDLVLASPEPGKVAARAQVTLEDALAKLKPSLQKVVHALKELAPDETVVEFGLKMGGETGVIIAKGTAEVNFTVRMSWKPK
jgi:hypothetical protein